MSSLVVDRPRPEVAVVTLNRPDALNALTFELVDELHAELDALDSDNVCRASAFSEKGSPVWKERRDRSRRCAGSHRCLVVNYDEGNFDVLEPMLTEDCHFTVRTDTDTVAWAEFARADMRGRDTIMHWQRQHRLDSPYPLRHNSSNVHIVEPCDGEARLRATST